MNYFKVNCVGSVGKKISMLDVECVQQRRLPYLHVIGGSSGSATSLRERVLAAIESSGFRLPARRFTVNLGIGGLLPPEELDLAVALAILGSAKAFPQHRMENFSVGGALSLDGGLLPLACRAPLRSFLGQNPGRGLLLPWGDSHILGAKGEGGGFRNLVEAVEFLRGEGRIGPRACISGYPEEKQRRKAWAWLDGRPIAQRLLPICAVGAHPMLFFGRSAHEISADLLSLLPELDIRAREEVESLHRRVGEPQSSRPLREVRGDQAARLLRYDAKSGAFGELSLAHGGLLHLSSFGERPLSLMRMLEEPLDHGFIRSYRNGRIVLLPADWQLVARTGFCLCGANGSCACTAHEAARWRQRLEQVRPFFPLAYQAEEIGIERKAGSLEECRQRVGAARALAEKRQQGSNNRLGLEACFKVKPWAEEAREMWRISRATRFELALARVALTVSDLRCAAKVEKPDLLEARYYVPESFVPRSRSGNSL